MRNFSNTYIFVFSVIMVVVVALLLSFVAMQLRPLQELNQEIERKSDILKSVGEAKQAAEVKDKNTYIEEEFDSFITDSYVVDFDGNVVADADAFEILLNIKEQADKEVEERLFPIFVYEHDGTTKYIVPVRGKGLWGPVWGYIAFNTDLNTIYGAIFDHQGETPGLGAEINTDWFEGYFEGKTIFDAQGDFVSVAVVKGKDTSEDPHAVDAISGGTITSVGVNDMLQDYLAGYVNHFKEKATVN